jgi:hypothetical protein
MQPWLSAWPVRQAGKPDGAAQHSKLRLRHPLWRWGTGTTASKKRRAVAGIEARAKGVHAAAGGRQLKKRTGQGSGPGQRTPAAAVTGGAAAAGTRKRLVRQKGAATRGRQPKRRLNRTRHKMVSHQAVRTLAPCEAERRCARRHGAEVSTGSTGTAIGRWHTSLEADWSLTNVRKWCWEMYTSTKLHWYQCAPIGIGPIGNSSGTAARRCCGTLPLESPPASDGKHEACMEICIRLHGHRDGRQIGGHNPFAPQLPPSGREPWGLL